MATMILLPDATGPTSLHWVPVGETYRHQCLDDDNDDTSYVSWAADAKMIILDFTDPTVAEADIDFSAGISIRFTTSGRCPARGASGSDVDIKFQTPSGFEE